MQFCTVLDLRVRQKLYPQHAFPSASGHIFSVIEPSHDNILYESETCLQVFTKKHYLGGLLREGTMLIIWEMAPHQQMGSQWTPATGPRSVRRPWREHAQNWVWEVGVEQQDEE